MKYKEKMIIGWSNKMKRALILLPFLLIFLLTACLDSNKDDNAIDDDARHNNEKQTEKADRLELTGVINQGDSANTDRKDGDEEHDRTAWQRLSQVERSVTSEDMRAFEVLHAVSAEKERYLAFGAYVMTNNFESIRIFKLGVSAGSAERLLRDFWSVEDRESALVQLERLTTATGQTPVADAIYNTLIKNDQLRELDGVEMYFADHDISGLEGVYNATVSRVERMESEFERFMQEIQIEEEYREEAYELFIYVLLAERVNSGIEAYKGAKDLLINNFGYTQEELLNLPTLAAWDYGRVAIIARYGAQAGYIEEDEAWEYLKLAADNASGIYSSWREYTAAHILGRALAFGNPSTDFSDTLDFLLNHPESSFQTIDFKIS